MPGVRPEPDDEIERDQREHASLKYALLSVVWITGGWVRPRVPSLLSWWQQRANRLHGHLPATQHGRREAPPGSFRFSNRPAVRSRHVRPTARRRLLARPDRAPD